jgi:hypothetical protein
LNFDTTVSQLIRYLKLNISEENRAAVISQYLPQQKPGSGIKIHFVHGKARRYLENFTEEELEYLNTSYQDILIEMGYEL